MLRGLALLHGDVLLRTGAAVVSFGKTERLERDASVHAACFGWRGSEVLTAPDFLTTGSSAVTPDTFPIVGHF